MVRWRYILFLSMLVVAQVTCSRDDDEPEEETTSTDDEDEDETTSQQPSEPSTAAARMTRTTSSPLQCYVCSYRRGSEPHCLDPLRHNMSSTHCPTPGYKCFTAVGESDAGVGIVVRGCKTDCISTTDVFCCHTDLCNSQRVGRPAVLRSVPLSAAAKLPQTVLYFVTVLLLLQAVVKVNIV